MLSFLLILGWWGWMESAQYHQAKLEVRDTAQATARAYAMRFTVNLDEHFADLQFIATTLLGTGFDTTDLTSGVEQSLRHYLALHIHLHSLVVRAADGHVVWTSFARSGELPADAGGFTFLSAHIGDMIGFAKYAEQYGGYILTLRYAVRDAAGKLGYFVDTPFPVGSLLIDTPAGLPWTLRLVDDRDGKVLGEVSRGNVTFPLKPTTLQGVLVPVSGYPFSIQANWAPEQVTQVYMRTAPTRWALELATVLILLAVAMGMLRALRQRDRHARRLQQLFDFSTLRTQVNQLIAQAQDEGVLLQSICDVATHHDDLALVWIGRPGADGVFRFAAAAGLTEYLDGALISADEGVPEGQGPAGLCWRERRASFHNEFVTTPALAPWYAHARRFDLQAVATLPVYRAGDIWAVLAVYHTSLEGFDEDLRHLLEELADDVSRGLDRLDVFLRERALREQFDKTQEYHRALFEHNAAGMCIVDDRRTIAQVNQAFCEPLGYAEDELVGQSTSLLYGSMAEFAEFKPEAVTTEGGFTFFRQFMRLHCKDGSYLRMQVLGAPVDLPDGRPGTLWSCIDVTALHQAQQELLYQALHDVLTDLPNRHALEQHLPKAVARAQRNGTALAIGVIDLDDFKSINKQMGAAAGDLLLKEMGARLQAEMRQSDFLARSGGDEFVIVFEELNEMYAIQQLHAAVDRLHRVVERPFEIGDGRTATIDMSMGVAIFPFDALDGGVLLRQADAVMYQAKAHKRGRGGWWKLSAASAAQPIHETVLEPYGEEAARLLGEVRGPLEAVADKFVEAFYSELVLDGLPHAILSQLGQEEMELLMRRQKQQLLFLVAPDTSLALLAQRARRQGETHTLVGVSASLMAKAQALYRRLLSEHLNGILMPARDRYRVMLVVETRLQDDMQLEFELQDATIGNYIRSLSGELPQSGAAWVDVRRGEVAGLGR
ncbi:MAG: diguanylate cyclase, partial [Burkholderiaceae bacterium]|nr:diguanylate cyclase [Burkholderiaceae bacterium]